MNIPFLLQTDFYKVDHRRQYPKGTEYVYSNFTPRATRVPGVGKVVFAGLQLFLQRQLMENANGSFFARSAARVRDEYKTLLDSSLGPNAIGVEHINELWNLGYLPLRFCALPEGTHVPLRCPMFTVENTHPDFFWLTNYIETMLSAYVWPICTSATTAYRYRQLLDAYAAKTNQDAAGFVDWQGHDFSYRGMMGSEAAMLSGIGHLTSFMGTDTIPAIWGIEKYYDKAGAGGSVAATEHSVMCAGGKADELGTFNHLLDVYPSGIVSVVSDTWDLWKVIDEYLPALKDRILARDGKLVIRPDSGDPVEILCGEVGTSNPSRIAGLIQRLWEIFGGTVNKQGFKVLDPHIGAIYGDSITVERARDICERLESKGFASTNVVLGIGSYTYQHVTRDTYGFAVKATWSQCNGVEHELFKDPVTDDGTKRSLRGRIAVVRGGAGGKVLETIDGLALAAQRGIEGGGYNLLQPVWENGKFLRRTSFDEVRARVREG